MKKIILMLCILLATTTIKAQDITGQWNGILKVQGSQLRVVFHIKKTKKGYSSTMDSPDQGAKGIATASTTFKDSNLSISMPKIRMTYEGKLLKNGTIEGIAIQNKYPIPLTLSQGKIYKLQDPRKPYPYISEDITYKNTTDKITLAGTLTLPKEGSNFPVVLLISGSGAQDRNSEIMGHKPFLVIADELTKRGIAVLRVDDRETGKSEGNYNASSLTNFKLDAQFAIEYLKTRKEINPKKIGIIGHSLGGLLAPILASESSDISFIIMLAGPGIRGDKLMLLQKELIEKNMGVSTAQILIGQKQVGGAYDIILKSEVDSKVLESKLFAYFSVVYKDIIPAKTVKILSNQLAHPWMSDFIKHDPNPVLKKVKCPVLALNGSKDLQVPAKENLGAIQQTLTKSGNENVTTTEFPNLNHLFQECKTGLPNEYGPNEQTFSPTVLKAMGDWILNL